MPSGSKHIQCLAIPEEDGGLSITNYYIGADAVIADGCIIRKAMDDFISHFVRIFYNIKDSRHFVSPFC
jgi:hypothetical protein